MNQPNLFPPALGAANLYETDFDDADESAPYGPGIKEDQVQSRSFSRRELGLTNAHMEDQRPKTSFLALEHAQVRDTKTNQIGALMEQGKILIDRLPSETATELMKALDSPGRNQLSSAISNQFKIQHADIECLNNVRDAGRTDFVASGHPQKDQEVMEPAKEHNFHRGSHEKISRSGTSYLSSDTNTSPELSKESLDYIYSQQMHASDGYSSRKSAISGQHARRKSLVRFRWALAIWYATEESQRLKSQRRSTEFKLQVVQRAGQNFVDFRRASAGPITRKNSQNVIGDEDEGVDQRPWHKDVGSRTFAKSSLISKDHAKSFESTSNLQKASCHPHESTPSRWQQLHKIIILFASFATLYLIDIYVITTEKTPKIYDILVV